MKNDFIRIAIMVDMDEMLEEMIYNTLVSNPNSNQIWMDAFEESLHNMPVPLSAGLAWRTEWQCSKPLA